MEEEQPERCSIVSFKEYGVLKAGILSSMYVKKLSAPPRAPLLMKRMTSTQSFMSLGVGRAPGSIRKVSRIRISRIEQGEA